MHTDIANTMPVLTLLVYTDFKFYNRESVVYKLNYLTSNYKIRHTNFMRVHVSPPKGKAVNLALILSPGPNHL